MLCNEQNSEWKCKISQTHGDRNVSFLPQNNVYLCIGMMASTQCNEKIHAVTKGFLQFWAAVSLMILFIHLTSFCFVLSGFAPHSCWQYWWNGIKPKITVGPAVYIVGPTKFIRRQSRSKKAEASKAPATKIVCCKFNHYYQVMLLNCSCKFLIIKDTPGMVESDINPKRMALRFYLLTTDSNITIDILSLFQTTLPHLERQPLISSQAK